MTDIKAYPTIEDLCNDILNAPLTAPNHFIMIERIRTHVEALRKRVELLRQMAVQRHTAIDPKAAREWVDRLKASKVRNIEMRKRYRTAIARHENGSGYYPYSMIDRVRENLKEAEDFAARVDSQIAFIEQFAAPELSAGAKLFEKRHPHLKFQGLSIESQDLWEELARHTDE